MAKTLQPVRGMNDILPAEAPYWQRLESSAGQLFAAYGYQQIRLPVLERTELFSRSIGESTDIVEKEMYTFNDRNGDQVTMRPEATASVVRACLSNGLIHNQQQKLWTSGPMFRHERPQKGRYRQFHQLSVEALGYAEPEIDAELIVIAARLWQALGITSVRLELNSLGTLDARNEYKKALVAYFSKHADMLDDDSRRRLDRNPLRILDSKNEAMRELIAEAPLLADYLDDESQLHFEAVKQHLSDVGIAFDLNPRLVRGLDYYSRTVFEWITDRLGAQSAICSGGRYDGLVAELGGRDTPAVGWALGVERVVELMRIDGRDLAEPAADVCLVTVGDAARRRGFALAETLRRALPTATIAIGQPSASVKAQLRRADKSGARFALILGDDEVESGTVTLKDLRSDAPQQTLPDDNLVTTLAAALQPLE
ncbi:MAG: histidine--tRNA ligase [Gammaproteobacteria bacterium]|nr:histidine--tRNA ligase [Gammaproteobacteria bacterium]